MKKKKYDTSIVMLYLLGQEKILPKEFRKKIPYSTISTWRKEKYESYEGSEYRFLFDDNWDLIKLKHENRKLKSALRAIANCRLLLGSELNSLVQERKGDKDFQNKLVVAVNILKPYISQRVAIKSLCIHKNQFYEWSIASRHNCSHSYLSLCLRRYPRQLQRKEVDKIKDMITSASYEHWPIVSIAAYALRKKSVVASLYSWYKYGRLFNLSHQTYSKTKKQTGLVAEKPNEYLHIDTTYYYISEGKKVCITFVMDNYSKMILGFSVEERLSFSLIRTAITNALTPILEQQNQNRSFLVSDGGKENNNKQIDQFISEISEHKLTKITALKDIQFSNSPVEAIHKIMKGRYIRNKRFETIEGLTKFLNEAVKDYNYERPHYKHFPKTPAEVYFEVDLKLDIRKRTSKASQQRIKNNLATACRICRKPIENSRVSLTHPPSVTSFIKANLR